MSHYLYMNNECSLCIIFFFSVNFRVYLFRELLISISHPLLSINNFRTAGLEENMDAHHVMLQSVLWNQVIVVGMTVVPKLTVWRKQEVEEVS